MMSCPLCAYSFVDRFHRDRAREYLRCRRCALVFVPPQFHLRPEEERAVYELHENHVDDRGYRKFLGRLAEPLLERLPAGACGLDFGCGPAPALAAMLEEAGHRVVLYDTFFFPEPESLSQPLDFITATEVVEHLHGPREVLEQLWSLLRPGGWLGLMTKLVRDPESFARWHYIRDPTHVCFFSRETLGWWAAGKGETPEFIGADVILLRKRG
jgi:SAM-dependent methyltransferase